ncbi:hypothetical protein ACFPT7_23255 [Acidicapsa dinghuensis]|uniref:Uncharacterized protein n=1 Tax=Acidicapsa dinghuensis TaxID=2218256 RepID=A0ABW1EPN7_9BACT|nr:hypothetical protein [Acidicapsa dinghuensis]
MSCKKYWVDHINVMTFVISLLGEGQPYNRKMQDLLSQIQKVLTGVILPHLKGIQVSQTEQRLETERLNRNFEEFRVEMQTRFAELRSELVACRQELEDAMVTIREIDGTEFPDHEPSHKKRLIH